MTNHGWELGKDDKLRLELDKDDKLRLATRQR